MKNRTKLPNIYLGVVLALMYVPILVVILYSFNESRISSVWEGFSLKWYEELFRDRDLFQALWNSILLGVISSCCAPSSAPWGLRHEQGKFPQQGGGGVPVHPAIMVPEIIWAWCLWRFSPCWASPLAWGR